MSTGARATGTATGMEQSGGQMASGSRARGPEPAAGYERRAGYEAGREASAGTIGGSLAVLSGLLTFLAGLSVVVRPHFYPTLSVYAYTWNGTGWGWVLLVLGVLLFAAGASALLGIAAARAVAIGLAVLVAISGFMFLPYAPIWGVVVVFLAAFAIWGLARDSDRGMSRM
jgi:hypothetical protein